MEEPLLLVMFIVQEFLINYLKEPGTSNLWELQLKGSGLTPYSRFADGKAVLRSSIREFLCSEAMHALGIPTTRAAALVVTDDKADRDINYNRNVIKEQCAVLLRLSPTFLRFGSFEICNPSSPSKEFANTLIPQLYKYLGDYHLKCERPIFEEIVHRTAQLAALWQASGFCHGVLNTDNMSVLGLTLDYGPFGFQEYFDLNHICNSSDKTGLYSYSNQPYVLKWNLLRFSEALSPVIDSNQAKEYVEKNYLRIYEEFYYKQMAKKLGIQHQEYQLIKQFVDSLIGLMNECNSDFTTVFRILNELIGDENFEEFNFTHQDKQIIQRLIDCSAPYDIYLQKKKPNLSMEDIQKFRMLGPLFLTQFGLSEEYLKQQENENKNYEKLLQQKHEERISLIELQWQDLVSQLKCMKKPVEENVNPIYILRNSAAQVVIEAAEQGNYEPLNIALEVLENPFKEQGDKASKIFEQKQMNLCVSCSS